MLGEKIGSFLLEQLQQLAIFIYPFVNAALVLRENR
jgi:hypothetical protein